MPSFKESLQNDNVLDDAKKIVPSLAANKQRLEVAKIEKIIAKETDGNFDKMTTDEDVYAALKTLNTIDLRQVFKTCAKALGAACNNELLGKLNKNRAMALFFHVFGVYPEATRAAVTPEIINRIEEVAKINQEDFAEVFPNFSGAVEVDFSKVANLLPEEFRQITSAAELRQNLSEEKIPEGKIVRDFVKSTLEVSGIEFDLNRFMALLREQYLPLFFHVINFVNFPEKKIAAPPAENKTIAKVTFGQMQAIYNAAQKISVEDSFDIAETLKIFEGNSVTVKDNFYLNIPDDREIYRGLVAIATLEDEIAAIGHFEDGMVTEHGVKISVPHLVFDWNRIKPEKFLKRIKFLAVFFPAESEKFFSRPMSQNLAESYSGEVWTMEFDAKYRELEVTDKPLCIDFGTSNTTAGTYDLTKDGLPDQVTFRDVTQDKSIFSEVLPTIVYVDSCRDGIVTFKHGYEAKREIIAAGYNTKATVFYEIKRWINSLDTQEEVTDGREIATITRREILKDYLLYVIATAEQQYKLKFKNLHMTAPVKLRVKFLNEMEKIFAPCGYKVDKNSLDEGLASVYHYIAKKIQKGDKTSGKILVLDCGGGTTDLASCDYSIEQGGDWPVLKLETDFESCDSNFGGNNITYRILQMLKMKIAANLKRNENLPMHELIPEDDDDILSQIDYHYSNKDKIYKKFQTSYDAEEEFIPTKFAEYRMRNERIKVKRNFYYLWQLAEAIKIEFFKSNLVNVDFEKDKKIFVRSPEEYYLSVRVDGRLQNQSDPMDGVEITIREIVRILLPDLYDLLKTLLNHYGDTNLMNYKYQLSGQSCKINKFRDLFKEFVPGKYMRIPQNRGESKSLEQVDSVVLKKYCILGSIEYVRDAKALGKYKAIIQASHNRRIYSVNNVINKDEKILLGRDGHLYLKKFPIETADTKFLVRGENDRIERREIPYHFDKSSDAENFTLPELLKIMSNETTFSKEILEEEIGDKLQDVKLPVYNGKVQPIFCLAALDAKSGYGFNIYQIGVDISEDGATEYWLPKKRRFESYEDENLQTFFNGDK